MLFNIKTTRFLCCCLLMVCINGCATNNTPHAFNMYRGSLSHTGYFPAEKISLHPKLIGKFGLINHGIHTASKSSPIIDSQNIYVGSDTGILYAIDNKSFEEKWKFKVRKTAIYGIHSTPAYDETKIYTGSYDGWLYALDKKKGKLIWQSQLGNFIGSSPVLYKDRLYIGVEWIGPNGYIAAVDKKSGSIVAKSPFLGHNVHGTPTIDDQSGILYIGCNNNKFYALDLTTLKVKWIYQSLDDIKSTAALSGDKVLFTSWDKYIYCLNKEKGTLIWKFKAGDKIMSSPTVDTDENKVYFGSHDRKFYCLDLNSGKKLWEYKSNGYITSSGTLVNTDKGKIIMIGSYDYTLYGLDTTTGQSLFSLKTQGKITSVPTVSNNRLYLSGDDGWLYILE